MLWSSNILSVAESFADLHGLPLSASFSCSPYLHISAFSSSVCKCVLLSSSAIGIYATLHALCSNARLRVRQTLFSPPQLDFPHSTSSFLGFTDSQLFPYRRHVGSLSCRITIPLYRVAFLVFF